MRHGEARNNVLHIVDVYPGKSENDLTEKGIHAVQQQVKTLKEQGGVDIIYSSDLLRAKHTAEIIGSALGISVQLDPRLREYSAGIWNGKSDSELDTIFPKSDRWDTAPEGGETFTDLQNRLLQFIKEVDKTNQNKKILVVTHGDGLLTLQKYFGSEREYTKPAEVFELDVSIHDLHRPYIDEVVLKCPRCGKDARRVKEIFDSWVEAGSMPFAEYHYPFDQKEIFESRFPAQFVAEYIAQTRAWFYVMHVASFAIFGKAPFENVVTTGTILAKDGSKMSKSKNNFPDPWEVIEKYGVDALRFYLMNSPVMQADNLNFSVRDLEIAYRKVIVLLWNVWKYFDTYAREAKRESGGGKNSADLTALDKWILARAKELAAGVGESLDKYDTVKATRIISDYIDDLSTWYLRRSRGRKDGAFFATLREALVKTSRVIAPVMPYLSEILYLNLIRDSAEAEYPESVHLSDWPETEELSGEEKNILLDMNVIREAASIGQAARKQLNIPVRQPLPRLAFSVKNGSSPQPELIGILLEELNVKFFDPTILASKDDNISMFPGTVSIANFYIDTAISENLRLEGLVRGLERGIQGLRKIQGFKVGEIAELRWKSDDGEIKKALEMVNKEKTYLSSVKENAAASEILEVDGKKLFLSLARK